MGQTQGRTGNPAPRRTAAVLNASFHETVDNEDHPAPDLGTPGDIFSITIGGTAYNCTPLENPDGGVYFPCTSEDIIAIVNAAIATHERDVMIRWLESSIPGTTAGT